MAIVFVNQQWKQISGLNNITAVVTKVTERATESAAGGLRVDPRPSRRRPRSQNAPRCRGGRQRRFRRRRWRDARYPEQG